MKNNNLLIKKIKKSLSKINKESKLIFKNSSNETIYSISKNKRLEIINFLNKLLKYFNINIISIFLSFKKQNNIICYKSKQFINKELKNHFINLISIIFKLKWKMDIKFYLVNFYFEQKNALNFDFEEFKITINNILKFKKNIILPIYPKKIRIKINKTLSKYKNIKYKTIGELGEKQIFIKHKIET